MSETVVYVGQAILAQAILLFGFVYWMGKIERYLRNNPGKCSEGEDPLPGNIRDTTYCIIATEIMALLVSIFGFFDKHLIGLGLGFSVAAVIVGAALGVCFLLQNRSREHPEKEKRKSSGIQEKAIKCYCSIKKAVGEKEPDSLREIEVCSKFSGFKNHMRECPFCGGVLMNIVIKSYDPEENGIYVECRRCGARGPRSGALDNAVYWWNKVGRETGEEEIRNESRQ